MRAATCSKTTALVLRVELFIQGSKTTCQLVGCADARAVPSVTALNAHGQHTRSTANVAQLFNAH